MVLILYSDSYLECDYAAAEQAFVSSSAAALPKLYRNADRCNRNNAYCLDGQIVQHSKKEAPHARHAPYRLRARGDASRRVARLPR